MPAQTIYTKTAKGVLEVKNKTIRMPRELGLVFLAVDGKSTFADLPNKAGLSAAGVAAAVEKLVADGYIKVFAQPTPAAAGAEDFDLDFTSPTKVALLSTEADQRAKAEADAKARAAEAARAATEAKARQEVEARARAAAEANARQEMAAKLVAEEQARAAARATATAQVEINAATEGKARAEAETRMRDAMAAKVKADTEAQARAAAEARATLEVQAKARAEASARIEAEARAKAEAEARARAQAEARARSALEAKMRAMEQALKQAEERAKTESEARARAEADARARTEVESIARAEAEARATAAEEAIAQARAMAAAAAAAKTEAETRVQAEIAARASAENRITGQFERKIRAEADATVRAAEAAREEAIARAEQAAHTFADAEARMKAEAEARATAEARARSEAERRTQNDADKLQRDAELQIAREEAEAKTRAEFRVLEENLRQARADAQAREETERKARQEAEARIAAERKAREEAEAQVLVERQSRDAAVSTAREEAEHRARAEVETRIGAERKTRDETEAKLALVRDETERKTQAELEARIDTERRAREDAERKAQAAIQISATAEKLIREAAGKETAVAEKSRDEAQKMRDEAQKMLDTARLQHEQAVAKAQAEMTARVRAEQKAITEKRARAAAEDRAKQEAVARVMQEHQMRQNAEREIEAKVEAELRSRSLAEFDSEVQARTDAQARADAVAAKRSFEKERTAAKGIQVAAPGKPVKWGRMIVTGLIVAGAIGVGLLQIMPLSGFVLSAEKILSERLQEPVNIGALRFTLFPSPQLKIEQIAIGQGQDVRIDNVVIAVSSLAILDERKEFDEVELTGLVADQDAIPRMVNWAQPPSASTRLQLKRIKINGIKLALRGGELPGFDAVITLGKDGGWQKASLRSTKASVELLPLKEAGTVRASFTARGWQSPVGPAFEFSDLSATATINSQQMTISGIEGRVFGGALKGAAIIKWQGGLSAEGELSLKGADVGQALAGFTRDFTASGTLDTIMKFTSQGKTADELYAAPRVTATFTLQKGTLNNIDLVRAIQSTSRGGLRGGKTPYNEISGEAQSAGNRIAYRNLKLAAGPLNATGTLDVSPSAELAGRLDVQLGTQSISIARGVLNVRGGMKDPVLGQ